MLSLSFMDTAYGRDALYVSRPLLLVEQGDVNRMIDLASRHASPDGTATLLSEDVVQELQPQVPDWQIEQGRLARDFRQRNFKEALALVNAIGATAESENHHPDITIHRWNRVRIELYTHSVEGLSVNDFILAAKISALYTAFSAGDSSTQDR